MANDQTNNSNNVSVAKTKVTGYAYWAPKGTPLPTDATSPLNDAFQSLGYVGEDGITNATDSETTEIKEMGGATVLKVITSYSETYQFILIEVLRVAAAALRYGSDNVSGEDGALTITHTIPADDEFELVFELALTGNRKDRIVIPAATRAEFGDRTMVGTEALGYDVTVSANPSDAIDGGTSREYIAAVTTATAA